MKVEILEFAEGAGNARGVAVIIDVFRAFSVACYSYDAGAVRIIATSTPEDAFKLKKKYKNSLLVGERNERKIEGFDFGNSPTEIIKANLEGKTIIHTTTAGTQGLIKAVNADMIIAGSLVNAYATVRYLKSLDPELVSLVAMGYRAAESAEEDLLCAEIIKAGLNNVNEVYEKRISDLKYSSGKRFFIPGNIEFSPPTDYFLCTMVDRFDFALRAEARFDGNIDLIKVDI
jgi:2-phosphosulfolactate phosphatase